MRDRVTRSAYGLLLVYGLALGLPGPAVPALRATFDLSYAGAALHLTLFSVGALTGSAAAGRLGGFVDRHRLVRLSLVGLGLGGAVAAAAPAAAVSLAATGVMGLFGVVAVNVGQGVLGERHGEGSAAALSTGHVISALGLVGAALALAVARLAGPDGWRVGFLVPAVVVGLLLLLRQPQVLPARAPRPGKADRHDRELPAATWIAAGVTGLGVGVEWAVTFWAAAYLQDEVGLQAGLAGAGTVVVLGGLVTGRLLVARLARDRPPHTLLLAALGVVLAASVPYLLGPGLAGGLRAITSTVALIVLCLAVAWLFPLALALTMTSAPGAGEGAQERASALALGAGAVVGICVPYALGALADMTSLRVALTAVPVGAVLAGVGVVTAWRTRPR